MIRSGETGVDTPFLSGGQIFKDMASVSRRIRRGLITYCTVRLWFPDKGSVRLRESLRQIIATTRLRIAPVPDRAKSLDHNETPV